MWRAYIYDKRTIYRKIIKLWSRSNLLFLWILIHLLFITAAIIVFVRKVYQLDVLFARFLMFLVIFRLSWGNIFLIIYFSLSNENVSPKKWYDLLFSSLRISIKGARLAYWRYMVLLDFWQCSFQWGNRDE